MTQQETRNPDEAYVGKDLGSNEFTASDELLHIYFEGLEVDSSYYSEKVSLWQASRTIHDSHQRGRRLQRRRVQR